MPENGQKGSHQRLTTRHQVEGETVECGYLIVAEDRADPGSPTIRLAVAIFAHPDGDPEPDPITNKEAIELVQTHANYLWTLVAACLVFFMQAGFAMVETGFTRAKNAVNIMMKNLMDFEMGSLAFWVIGFGLMFRVSSTGWVGTSGFFLSCFKVGGDPWVLAFWMFQVVFAATAATIVSGAMAERTKFVGYLLYSVLISAIIYPIFGSWAWGSLLNGSGWLENLGFIDFAGSTVVHSVGGWAAPLLIAAGATAQIVLEGPRWNLAGLYAAAAWLLVADVVNETEYDGFTLALKSALETDLRQSRHVNVFDSGQVHNTLRMMRRDVSSEVDLETGLEVCRFAGVRALLRSGG